MKPEPSGTDSMSSNQGDYGLVITCEHGGNRIPKQYQAYFDGYQDLLDSHRGFDPGALVIANILAKAFSAPSVTSTVSRLLVDLNRSIGHPDLHFSTIQNASATLRQKIVQHYYQPYRTKVEGLIRQTLTNHNQVIHISSHSFTPKLNDRQRNADIGLLYDPSRPGEVCFCEFWKSALKTCAPELKVRRNYPYQGKADGLTRWFRRELPADTYLGIELEINQKHILTAERHWLALCQRVVESLHIALTNYSAYQVASINTRSCHPSPGVIP